MCFFITAARLVSYQVEATTPRRLARSLLATIPAFCERITFLHLYNGSRECKGHDYEDKTQFEKCQHFPLGLGLNKQLILLFLL